VEKTQMKILHISNEADSLDLALTCQREGAEVSIFVHDMKFQPDIYENIMKISKTWTDKVAKADFVYFDSNDGLSPIKQAIWNQKKPAFNTCHTRKPIKICGKTIMPWEFPLATEQDRNWAHKLLEFFKIGNKMPSWQFTKVDEAAKFIKENPKAYVMKVEGAADSDLTYVGITEDGEDVLEYLTTLPMRPDIKQIKKIELEEKKKGIEIATSAYFNGKDFYARDINFEHKKFATGSELDHYEGIGFNTGEQGTVIRPVSQHRLFTETVEKMGNFLKEIDFRGQIDINGVLNDDGYWPVEFTIRPGYPASAIEVEARKMSTSEFLYSVSAGETPKIDIADAWIIGVVLCGQGYPFYADVKKSFLLPIIGVNKDNVHHLHFSHVKALDSKLYTVNSYICTATALGKDIKSAQHEVYNKLIAGIKIPNAFWRTDIGTKVSEYYLPKLEKMGYGL
jgi:phosphoribosylamine--glycine ligase